MELSVDSNREYLNRPMLLVALGETGRLAAEAVFARAVERCGQVPFHLGWVRLKPSPDDGRIGLRLFARDAVADGRRSGAADLASAWDAAEDLLTLSPDADRPALEPLAERLLQAASGLCASDRREAAEEDSSLAFVEAPPEIVLLADQSDSACWWRWARELGRQCLMNHRVLAIVFCACPLPKRDLSPLSAVGRLADDLRGELCFSQVYVIGDRNQRGSAIGGEERVRVVTEFLLDRTRPADAARLDAAVPFDWIDPNDEPAGHLRSLSHHTLRFDPEELVAHLHSREYLDEISREEPDETAGQDAPAAVPGREPLEQIARDALAPNPASGLAGPQAERANWPRTTPEEIDRRAAAYEGAIENLVDQLLGQGTPKLAAAHAVMAAAHRHILAVSERLHLDALAADRAQKLHDLEHPCRTGSHESTADHPRKRTLLAAAFALGGISVAGVVLAAVLGGGVPGPMVLAFGLTASIALFLAVWALRLPSQTIQVPYAIAMAAPFDLKLIRYAERRLACLLRGLLDRADRAGQLLRQCEEATRLAAETKTADSPPPHGLDDADLERIAAQVKAEHRDAFREAAAQFSRRAAEAVSGRLPIEEVFGPLREALRPMYEFLYAWDVQKLLAVARGVTVDEQAARWRGALNAMWPVADQECATEPEFVTLVQDAAGGNGRPSPSRIRVYKFCLGVQPAAIPAPRPRVAAEKLEHAHE